ncbi:hypothetical protein CKO20_12005 [Rhodocyclus tenuis]|nr:hypothetical protein [Rhodocyclus tenuis]
MTFVPPTETLSPQWINSALSRTSFAWLALGFLLLLSLGAWQYSAHEIARNNEERFQYRAQKQTEVLVGRMHDYERVLRGSAGLFAASETVSRQEWRAYVAQLQLGQSLPGILGTGFAMMLPKSALSAHEAAIRAEGFPDYRVHPPGERELYSSIIYLEPVSGRNLLAFGYDMYAEPVRREAMDRARDSGEPALSGRVQLIQENGRDVQPGFLIYLPVYRNGRPQESVEQRRLALVGFVYSPFRAFDLMRSIFGTGGGDLEVEVYDDKVQPENLLYASERGARQARHQIDLQPVIAGHRWTVRFRSSAQFEADTASPLPMMILLGGLAFGGFLFSVLYLNARHRQGMEAAAAELARRRDEYLTLVENVPGTVFRSGLEAPWHVQHISRGIEVLTGEPPARFLSGELSLGGLIVAEDRAEVAAAVAAAIAGRRSYDIAYRINSPAGGVQWVSERGRAWYDEAGKAQWLDGVIVDITEQKSAEEHLRAASLYARSLIEASLDPLLAIGADGTIMDANSASGRVVGVPRETLIGSEFSRYFTAPASAAGFYRQVFELGYVIDYPLAIRQSSGEQIDILFSAIIFRDESGEVAGAVAAGRDVTRLRRAQLELEETNREIRALRQMTDLLQAAPSLEEAYTVIRNSMDTLFPHSAGACFMRDDDSEQLRRTAFWGEAQPPSISIDVGDCWALRTARTYAAPAGPSLVPRCPHSGDESTACLCIPLHLHEQSLGVIYLGASAAESSGLHHERRLRLANMAADSISLALANLRLRDSLRAQSLSDPLTGLFNRRFMEETLARELSRLSRISRPMAVAMVDVDRFKDFNDAFGHEAGDLVLQKIAGVMLAFRRGMDVACRYGGEEFVLILPEISVDAARERFEEFRRAIAALALEFEGQALPGITVSIGVAFFPQQGTSSAELIRAADRALYAAKRAGRNRVVLADEAQATPVAGT